VNARSGETRRGETRDGTTGGWCVAAPGRDGREASVTRSQPATHLIHTLPDQTCGVPILTAAILTMTTAQLLDLGTFVTMVRRLGPAAEANPIVIGLLQSYGFPMAAIAKVAVIALVVAVSVVLMNRDRPIDRLVTAAVLAVAIVAGLIGGGSNVLALGSAVSSGGGWLVR
jgi:hypothetical protein